MELDDIFNKYYSDFARIKYYPINIQNSKIINLEFDCFSEKIDGYLSKKPHKKNDYNEISFNDVWKRKYIGTNIINYFRKRSFAFSYPNIDGLWVLDLYTVCDDLEFPHIVDYHYNTMCSEIDYELNYSHIRKVKTNNNNMYYELYVDVIEKNLQMALNNLIMEIESLKKLHLL